eukprot:352421-Chlamydomonas_euryale.AAC.88
MVDTAAKPMSPGMPGDPACPSAPLLSLDTPPAEQWEVLAAEARSLHDVSTRSADAAMHGLVHSAHAAHSVHDMRPNAMLPPNVCMAAVRGSSWEPVAGASRS